MATFAGVVMEVPVLILPRDYQDGGAVAGTVAGTVETQTAPATFVPTFAHVVLFRDHDHQPIRDMWSDRVTGAWSFGGIDKSTSYTAIAFHPTLAYRGVLADGVFPT